MSTGRYGFIKISGSLAVVAFVDGVVCASVLVVV